MAKWVVLFASLMLAAGVVLVLERGAANQAKAFCGRFTIGAPFADVQRAAADRESGIGHREIQADQVAVAFMGLPPFPRHICIVEALDGRVTSTRYRYD